MGRLLGFLAALIGYLCVATVISEAILVVTLSQRLQIDRPKIIRMMAAAYGLEPAPTKPATDKENEEPSGEQPSLEQVLEARAIKVRHLELREQSLRASMEQLRNDQRSLADDKKKFKQVKQGFDAELLAMREGAAAAGVDDVRRTLETIKPRQAKDQILKMLEDKQMDRVVRFLAEMPDSKRAKIIAEFKTPEESDQLHGILRRLGEGTPPTDAFDTARQKLAPPASRGS